MDGGSCDLEGATVVASGDSSPASAACAGIPLRSEKCCAFVDEACGAAGSSSALQGAPVVTSADDSLARAGVPLPCASVDETCETAVGSAAVSEAQICVDFSKSISLEVKKGLQKCVTFPPSSGQPEQENRSCCHADDVLTGAPAYERSVSLPPTLKLIPALKGGREKNGIASPTENRHVKWAPDVYDPPVTSVCHSVTNSYQRRSKHRKKEKEKKKQKKKQKGKSKKNQQNSTQNSSVLQVPDLGLKGVSTTGGQSSVDDLSKHEAGIMDYSMGSQEAKCGSSFLRESVAKMHFSIAEAS